MKPTFILHSGIQQKHVSIVKPSSISSIFTEIVERMNCAKCYIKGAIVAMYKHHDNMELTLSG